MALGKIKADTLEHSTAGSLDTQYVVEGSLKSWVNMNTTSTPNVLDSLNVSGLIDDAQGQINVAFTSSMANVNYAPVCCGTAAANGVVFDYISKVTGNFDWRQIDNNGTKQDTDNATALVSGDLA